MNDSEALRIAKSSFEASTTYVDSNYRKQWEDGLRMFQGRHPRESKYNSDAYKYRSRLFRPKTRSVVRRHEAIASAAFFSNVEVVSVSATDESNPMQLASAEINKELLQYRLTKTIPWYMTVMGAMQDACTVGVVCSYQSWKYRAKKGPKQVQIVGQDDSGMPIAQEVQSVEVIEDRPDVQLMPVENLRIDPAANWIDPIRSSPYAIRMVPMYMQDVRLMMEEADEKTGQPKWKKYSDGEIRSSTRQNTDETRQAREQRREDSTDQGALNEYEIVWAHENFIRWKGEEFVYWTLGTELLLTSPKPLKEVYFHGERPIVMGCVIVETHKPYPNGPATLGKDLQAEANEIVNQRLDNVKLVLNKRWLVKRGQNVDIESLQRNVAGGVTLVNDTERDVQEVNWPDVTASAFQEQDRVNLDYDELVGNFSQSSVQTNRSMNETVGGMNLISGSANVMVEYDLRVFTETWMEPVLRQLVLLEQHYETDTVVLALAGQRAELFQRFGVDQITDDLLMQELTLTVNVGAGATDPNQRLGRFVGALQTYANIASAGLPDVNLEEVGKEIFGLAGYKDGKRFLNHEIDPRAVQMAQQQVMQEVGPQLEAAQSAMQEADKFKQAAESERVAHQSTKMQVIDLKAQLDVERITSGMQDEKTNLALERIELNAEKQIQAIEQQAQKQIDAIRQQVMAEQEKAKADAEKEKESESEGESKKESAPSMPPINVVIGGQSKKVSIKAPSGDVYEGSIDATD